MTRLRNDVVAHDLGAEADEWLRVSAPPVLGMNLANLQFRRELKAAVRDFAPELVMIDPWNALARDSTEKDYEEGFERVREILAESSANPACLIVHHCRKPKSENRQRGRSLANLMAGSYTILSVPRSALILQPATDDTDDNRVVMTPAKNNDGELGARRAWERRNDGFVRCDHFDWESYDNNGGGSRKPKVRPEHLQQLFEGKVSLTRPEAVRKLQEFAGVARTAVYDALKTSNGRYWAMLRSDGDLILLTGSS